MLLNLDHQSHFCEKLLRNFRNRHFGGEVLLLLEILSSLLMLHLTTLWNHVGVTKNYRGKDQENKKRGARVNGTCNQNEAHTDTERNERHLSIEMYVQYTYIKSNRVATPRRVNQGAI